MTVLPVVLRNKLERTVIEYWHVAEAGAKTALETCYNIMSLMDICLLRIVSFGIICGPGRGNGRQSKSER